MQRGSSRFYVVDVVVVVVDDEVVDDDERQGGFWEVQKKSSCRACVRCAVWRLLMTTQIREKSHL
jgi:hypothetical protein